MAILGTKYGLVFLDPLVAVIETIDLMRLSVVMLNDSVKGMMDYTVSPARINQITSLASLVPGVQKITMLKA
ncbi:magnetosome protein MamM, partial [Candidatus Omnitrophus magneticus]